MTTLLPVFALLVAAASLLAEEGPLKLEILPKAVCIARHYELTVRFTNISSDPLSVTRGGFLFHRFEVREQGGKRIPEFTCDGVLKEPQKPAETIREKFLSTIAPGQSVDLATTSSWEIPEDGDFIVSFTYTMPDTPNPLHPYKYPAHVWRGSVRAPDVVIRLTAHEAPDPLRALSLSSLKRTCEVLDSTRRDDPPHRVDAVAARLFELGDPAAVPALERAVERGVFRGTATVLGVLGNERSFALLLQAAEKHKDLGAVDGLARLVHRSNLPLETWMPASTRVIEPTEDVIAAWLAWWKRNMAVLKITKMPEPVRREKQAPKPGPPDPSTPNLPSATR